MKTKRLFLILCVALAITACCKEEPTVTAVSTSEATFPWAEYDYATMILMYTPGEELFDGVIHPDAGLYDNYFDVDEAAKEHVGYIEMLRKNGIEVRSVKDVLMSLEKEELQALASKYLVYDAKDTQLDSAEVEAYRQSTLACMSKADLIRILFLHPKVVLHETGMNTGVSAEYVHEPLMNMYFMRDQSINTPRGPILCRMNSSQRFPEVDIVEVCYRKMGIEPVYRISGEDSYLEGGDYIPFGTFAFLGQGLRTSQGAIDEMLEHDVIGHDTLVVVRDHWKNQYQMHLDTYFNIIDKDLATLCFNRFDAQDTSDVNFLTIDMYARAEGEKEYHEVPEFAGYSFKQFLADRGIDVIRIDKKDADHYANNFLAIGGRHIMSVAGQSKELEEEYKNRNVNVEWVPLDNLIGGYGAAHCMTQVVYRKK